MISRNGRIFLISCYLLDAAVRLYDAVEENMGTNTVSDRYTNWAHEHETMAWFVGDSHVLPMEVENADREELRTLLTFGSNRASLYFDQAWHQLEMAVDTIHVSFPSIAREVLLYFYYSWSLREIVRAFQALVEEKIESSSPYGSYYRENLDYFNKLITRLEEEHIADIAPVRADLESVATRLASKWRLAVNAAIEEFQQTPLGD